MEQRKKHIYFASDFHLGIPDYQASLKREKYLVQWLDDIRKDAAEIFLMGDVFDFWFEYSTVVPKGYTRLFGKLAELTDQGIPIHLFKGNHDIWAFRYLTDELGISLHRKAEIKQFGNKLFFLAHGDGLGPGDTGYKLIKKLFENKCCQFAFKWIHPDIGTRLGLYFSRRSRLANIALEKRPDFQFNPENHRLAIYSKSVLEKKPQIDYFVFGHQHNPVDYKLNDKSRMILLGDWLTHFTYAVFDGEQLSLKQYPISY